MTEVKVCKHGTTLNLREDIFVDQSGLTHLITLPPCPKCLAETTLALAMRNQNAES